MAWKPFGRAGDAQGVSPFGDEPNRRLHFSGLIVFNVLRAGKFSSSIFAGAQAAGVGECAGRSAHVASDGLVSRAIPR
jgi:hypothetical protein